ncbi:MAG: helix-turn-helix transcriptional regulator [Clostridiales bacterium]|nr:helix-turn-helix transcriptional regulator [Clostridiales bacterium]
MISKLIKYIKDTPNKNSIIMLWARTIALFICISVLFGVITYQISRMQFRQRADQAYSVLINQIGASFDMNLSDAQTVLIKYLDDRKVERLSRSTDIDDIAYSQDKIDIISQMKTYIQLNSFISDIHLYFPNHDYIVTTETLSYSPAIHTASYKDYMPDFSEWHEYFYNRNSGDAFVLMTNSAEPHTGSSNELYFMLADSNTDNSSVQAYFSVQGTSMAKMLKNIELDEGVSIAIVLADGTVFVSSDYSVWGNILEETAFSQLALDGCDEMISTSHGSLFLTRSEHMNIYYALYASNSANSYSASMLLIICGISILITFLMAAFSTMRFAVRNASPLMEIRDMIATGDIGKNDSELSLIRDAVERSQQTVSHMTTTLQVKDRKLQDSYLAMLLNASEDNLPDEDKLMELAFKHDRFGVLVFSIENELPLSSEQDVFLIVLAEKCRVELAEKGIDVRYLTSDNMFIIVMNMDASIEIGFSDLAANTIYNFTVSWENNYDEQLICMSSAVHTGFAGAADAYREAIFALRYTLIHNEASDDSSSGHTSLIKYHYQITDDTRLSNLLLHGTEEELAVLLDELWAENNCGEFAGILLRCLSYDMAATALRIYQNTGSDIETEQRIGYLLSHMYKAGRDELKASLFEIFTIVNRECKVKRGDSQDKFCEDVLAYIRENYADPTLSIDSICEKFNRSRNYIYVAFKNSTGEGLLHHISTIRLEKAKQLLLEPKATVEKTAEAVGLNSALTLARIFKRYEGISPGKYIEENKKR